MQHQLAEFIALPTPEGPKSVVFAGNGATAPVVYAIHCRLRDFARNRQGKDFAGWVDKAWIDLLKIDAAHLIVHGDLGIGDRGISVVTQDRIQTCEWITFRRHRAIIWGLGHHPIYSQTPVDT